MSEERRLFERYRQSRHPADREALVVRFLPLARRLATRYEGRSEPLDDLIQVAAVGLLKAIDRFDPGRGCAFSSFAVPTIVGEIRRHFRDRTWGVHVPRGLRDLAHEMRRAEARLESDLGRAPSAAELATHCDVGVEDLLDARAAWAAHTPQSLDQAPATDDPDPVTALDLVPGDDPGFSVAEDGATLARLLVHLGDREREVLRLRFQEDLTQSEIGARIGCSQMHVSRLIRSAIASLQCLLEAGPTATARPFVCPRSQSPLTSVQREERPMADPVPAGSDVSAGTYKCTNCGYELQVGSTKNLPPCPSCHNGQYDTLTGGDSADDPYPGRSG